MENTLENKAKFFALYWGQKVMKQDYPTLENWTYQPNGFINSISDRFYLQLKPLTSISDEDAEFCIGKKECSMRKNCIDHGDYGMSPSAIFVNSLMAGTSYFILQRESEYLRSKGYAIKWLDVNVQTQIDYRWIKLKY